jgi:hypothetical protein
MGTDVFMLEGSLTGCCTGTALSVSDREANPNPTSRFLVLLHHSNFRMFFI